jgi:protein-S-isoprenylcysteine O-methyltransferase Ste14
MTNLKLFLLIYLFTFYATAFFWRSWQTWRMTGINPYRLNAGDSLHRQLGVFYRVITISIVITVLIYSFFPNIYSYLTPIQWIQSESLTHAGIAILLFSLVWVLAAQAYMGQSWRIGIDTENETTLVTHGIFKISRNPIFLGMRLNLLGFFLILPNAVTLLLWILGDVIIQLQVLIEEAFLQQQLGQSYAVYCQQVRRWV